MNIIVHTDGGSRGNPGPSALGVVIEIDGTRKEYGEYLGKGTNNEAEYAAVIFALKKVKQLIGKEHTKQEVVHVNMDSELICKQMNKEYKISDDRMKMLFMDVWNLTLDFKDVIFRHVRRKLNKGADAMVNAALDNHQDALF
ncbi:MAG: ribonuclease HI family protein [Patescibacteria group bacterium]|nr:ribonuclease HI family protein [Patescibacteria group bacterium]MDE2437837.1 ribonuclease HI family protein [Patescibacteria group bacterium]